MIRGDKTKRRKKYRIFDAYTTYFVPIGWTIYILITIGICIFFFLRFIIAVEDPALKDPGGWVCILMTLTPMTGLNIYFIKTKMFNRYFIRYQFSEVGIHCSGFTWGKFTVMWDSIHTYGFFVSAGANLYYPMVFFSQDPQEMWLKNPLTLRRDRLLFQYRKEEWQAICEYMPADMKKRLQDAIDHQRDGFYKR